MAKLPRWDGEDWNQSVEKTSSQIGLQSPFGCQSVQQDPILPMPNSPIKFDGAKLETPFLIRQVEGHLIFGPLSRHVPCAYVAIAGLIVARVAKFFTKRESLGQYLGDLWNDVIMLALFFLLTRMTYRQQAIIGWIAVKAALGFAAIMLMTLGAAVSFQRHEADAWPNLFLGLIWIPGIEFIPSVTPHQRYVTIARIVLSIPCIYFGCKSGSWHW